MPCVIPPCVPIWAHRPLLVSTIGGVHLCAKHETKLWNSHRWNLDCKKARVISPGRSLCARLLGGAFSVRPCKAEEKEARNHACETTPVPCRVRCSSRLA